MSSDLPRRPSTTPESSPGLTVPPSTREPGRRGKRGETRQRILQVTLELLRTEGMAALTTGRIASEAGIAQPGFYAHFKNVEECLSTALSGVMDEMRAKVLIARANAFSRFQTVEDLVNVEATRAGIADSLDVMLSDRAVAELFLRHRRDWTMLDGFLCKAHDQFREDLKGDMWAIAHAHGFSEDHRLEVAWWSEQILALFFVAAETLLDGRYENRDMVVEGVVRNAYAIMRANLRWAGIIGTPPIKK
jgi:AcrR family transcriptional regulator